MRGQQDDLVRGPPFEKGQVHDVQHTPSVFNCQASCSDPWALLATLLLAAVTARQPVSSDAKGVMSAINGPPWSLAGGGNVSCQHLSQLVYRPSINNRLSPVPPPPVVHAVCKPSMDHQQEWSCPEFCQPNCSMNSSRTVSRADSETPWACCR